MYLSNDALTRFDRRDEQNWRCFIEGVEVSTHGSVRRPTIYITSMTSI